MNNEKKIPVAMQQFWQSLSEANDELNAFIGAGMPTTTEKRLKGFLRKWDSMKERADALFDAIEQQADLHIEPVEVRLPFGDDQFAETWQQWKEYLAEQHNKRMKSRMERAALAYLKEIAKGKTDVAIGFLHFAMANGYPRFFIVEKKDYKRPTQNAGGRGDGDF